MRLKSDKNNKSFSALRESWKISKAYKNSEMVLKDSFHRALSKISFNSTEFICDV